MTTEQTQEDSATRRDGSAVQRGVRPLVDRLRTGVYGVDRIALCSEAARSIDAALHEAIAAVYFDDSSDFRPALLRIVSILGGPERLELLQDNPRACYAASAA